MSLPNFPNYVHKEEFHQSSSTVACSASGIIFAAVVVNPPDGIETQYCVVKRIDPTTNENREIHRFLAKDSEAYALANGADPTLINGKFGGVDIAVRGNDLVVVLEIRTNSINLPKWIVLKGKAV